MTRVKQQTSNLQKWPRNLPPAVESSFLLTTIYLKGIPFSYAIGGEHVGCHPCRLPSDIRLPFDSATALSTSVVVSASLTSRPGVAFQDSGDVVVSLQ